jgi:cysteine desulfurase
MAGITPIYLDCNATTPVEEEVIEVMTHYLRVEYGNAGSQTHRYGSAAAHAVRRAREQVAGVVEANWEDVIFTSGATESNNLALLGLAAAAEKIGKKHIISTQIEHKAVLEPLEELVKRGFDVTYLPPSEDGAIEPDAVRESLRHDTFMVSVMHVNNETGVVQPLRAIGERLAGHPAVFHTDSAQGFGKELNEIRDGRIDLISVSSHKIYGPKGVGALIVRPAQRMPRLRPLTYGGGQERGLRPGTVPVHLVAGLGTAAELAIRDHAMRRQRCLAFRKALLAALTPLHPTIHGDARKTLPSVINLRFGEIDSEAVMLALKDLVAISNGSACTSTKYEPSHVLKAMGMSDAETYAATRWSWSHLTPFTDWSALATRIRALY